MKKNIHPLLERINQISRMERGKICQMRGKNHFNHQAWENGRNKVRYVRPDKVESLQEAIDGYQLCMDLIQQYVEEVIQSTRLEEIQTTETRKRPRIKEK